MNKNITFKKAELNNLGEIFSIYTDAIIEMERHDINQWDELYPTKEILEADIKKQELYIGLIENKIAVAYVLNEECDEEYKDGEWEYPNSKFCVLHRICVNPEFQNQGIAKRTIVYIEEQVRQNGYDSIRLDCYTKNPFSISLYSKLGYKLVGYANWRKGRFELREKKV